MEAVKTFQAELSSLYDMRPLVSKAKMAMITKSAVKAIKFYKHVVQSVEKFVQKCKPEFKIPGLYVIDSIVRQSRHQFGAEKDVFGPRFLKNICNTFQNLLKCPKDDIEKIRRVLFLWQKNNVFPSDILQSLLAWVDDPWNSALADNARSVCQPYAGSMSSGRSNKKIQHSEPYQPGDGDILELEDDQDSRVSSSGTEVVAKVTKLLLQIQKSLQSGLQTNAYHEMNRLQGIVTKHGNLLSGLDASLVNEIRTLIGSLMGASGDDNGQGAADKNEVKKAGTKEIEGAVFNKKLLDYDYGDSEESSDENEIVGMDISDDDEGQNSTGRPTPVFTQPDLIQRIEEISKTLQKTEELGRLQQQQKLKQSHGSFPVEPVEPVPSSLPVPFPPNPANLPPPLLSYPPFMPQQNQQQGPNPPNTQLPPPLLGPDMMHSNKSYRQSSSSRHTQRSRDTRRRSRSYSRSRSRSRTRSPDRRRNYHRRYSRSRSRSRSTSRERRQRIEKERRRRGFPSVRENCVSIASTTIWVGHLSKHTREAELQKHCEDATGGHVVSINLIVPRGCAYVTFSDRRDALLAIDELQGVKIQGFAARVEWAQGNGVKGDEFKEAWNKKEGVTYIPWEQLGEFDLFRLMEGGIVDEDTLPEDMKEKFVADLQKLKEEKKLADELAEERARIEEAERLAATSHRRGDDDMLGEESYGQPGKFQHRYSGRGRGGGNFRGGRGGWNQNANRFNAGDRTGGPRMGHPHAIQQNADLSSLGLPTPALEDASKIRLPTEIPSVVLNPATVTPVPPPPVSSAPSMPSTLLPTSLPFGLVPNQPPHMSTALLGQQPQVSAALLPMVAQSSIAVPNQQPPQPVFAGLPPGTRLQLPGGVGVGVGVARPPQVSLPIQQAQPAAPTAAPQHTSQPLQPPFQQPTAATNTRPTGPGLLAVQQAIAAGSLSAEQQSTILGEKETVGAGAGGASGGESAASELASIENFIQQQQQQQQQILLPQNIPGASGPVLVRLPTATGSATAANSQNLPVIDVVSAMAQLRQQAEVRQQQQHLLQQAQQVQAQQLLQRVQQENLIRQLQQAVPQQQQQQQQQQQPVPVPPPGFDDDEAEAEEALRQMMAEDEEEEAAEQASQQTASLQSSAGAPVTAAELQRLVQQQSMAAGQALICQQQSQRASDSPASSSSSQSTQPQAPGLGGLKLPPGFPQISLPGFQVRAPFAGSPLVGLPPGSLVPGAGAEQRLQLPPGLQLQVQGGGLVLRSPTGFPAGVPPQRLLGPGGNAQLNQLLAAAAAAGNCGAFMRPAMGIPGAQVAPGPGGLFVRPGLPPNFPGAAGIRGNFQPQIVSSAMRSAIPGVVADAGITAEATGASNNNSSNGSVNINASNADGADLS